jgi:predicted negative regulator of RcsB-dependent stress response
MVHLLQSRLDEAIVWFEKSSNRALSHLHCRLASAYALKGETERATAGLAEAQRLSHDDRYSSIARFKVSDYQAVPENPNLAGSHLQRGPTQGWNARKLTAPLGRHGC